MGASMDGHGRVSCSSMRALYVCNAKLTQTVNAGAAGSHHNHGWEQFTREILKTILKATSGSSGGGPLASMFAKQGKGDAKQRSGPQKGVVFLAWGMPAAKTLAEAGINEVRTKTTMPDAENTQRPPAQVATPIAAKRTPRIHGERPFCEGKCMARRADAVRQRRRYPVGRPVVIPNRQLLSFSKGGG